MTSAPDRATVRSEDEETLEVVHLDERRGLGVRARRAFAAGSVMHRFAGIVGEQICQHSLQVDADRHISGTRYIGYLSHGCNPSAGLDMTHFALVARRDIAPGEIVTIDYAETEDRLHRQFACACAAATCRGWITGRQEAPNHEGRAWLSAHAQSPLPEREG